MAVLFVPVSERRRWFESATDRHATCGPPVRPGDPVPTLCGVVAEVTVPVPGRPAPECAACDRAWRTAEGIPQRVCAAPTQRAGG